jgi:3-(3-hydroxy-phenyl)propionate hydroxylase
MPSDAFGIDCADHDGLDFVVRIFENNVLIAGVRMDGSDFPVERRFWFYPVQPRPVFASPKQSNGVWRIDLQLGWNIDKADQSKPETVTP